MKQNKTTLKEYLEEILPQEKIVFLNRSFEVVGDIAICEIHEELQDYEKAIGEAIMKINKSIKVVLKKSGIHSGEFRTQDLLHIAGEERKETLYKENGIELFINPETVYFSAKLSTEREQLMTQLKKESKVLIMFSGGGPYTFVALKKQPNLARIESIELNPQGHEYALRNQLHNKNLLKKSSLYKKILENLRKHNIAFKEKEILENFNSLKIHQFNDDVKTKIPNLKFKEKRHYIEWYDNLIWDKPLKEAIEHLKRVNGWNMIINLNSIENKLNYITILTFFAKEMNFILEYKEKTYLCETEYEKGLFLNFLEGLTFEKLNSYDEIFMPLPKDAEYFLEDALKVSSENTLIHMYGFVHEKEFPQEIESLLNSYQKKLNTNFEIKEIRKVGKYAPGKYRFCTDFYVKN